MKNFSTTASEDALHATVAYGGNSFVSKLLAIKREVVPERIIILFIKE
jgi:hypothetical protein